MLWTFGAEGDRTPGLDSAIVALSHLSYGPKRLRIIAALQRLGQCFFAVGRLVIPPVIIALFFTDTLFQIIEPVVDAGAFPARQPPVIFPHLADLVANIAQFAAQTSGFPVGERAAFHAPLYPPFGFADTFTNTAAPFIPAGLFVTVAIVTPVAIAVIGLGYRCADQKLAGKYGPKNGLGSLVHGLIPVVERRICSITAWG